jgi:hypothetical protein
MHLAEVRFLLPPNALIYAKSHRSPIMNELISKLCRNELWKKWIASNRLQPDGCISVTKTGCVCGTRDVRQGSRAAPADK